MQAGDFRTEMKVQGRCGNCRGMRLIFIGHDKGSNVIENYKCDDCQWVSWWVESGR